EAALNERRTIIGLAQRDPAAGNPSPDDLFTIGTEIALGRILRMPDETNSMLAQGRQRVEIIRIIQTEPYIIAQARPIRTDDYEPTPEQSTLMKAVVNMFRRAVDLNANIPEDVLIYALNAEDPGWLADLVASTLSLSTEERQRVLEIVDPGERLSHVAMLLSKELNVLEIEDEISAQVQQEMERGQREMYLREQMRVIQTELGEGDIFQQELDDIRNQILQAQLPPEVHERAMKELSRLSIMP